MYIVMLMKQQKRETAKGYTNTNIYIYIKKKNMNK